MARREADKLYEDAFVDKSKITKLQDEVKFNRMPFPISFRLFLLDPRGQASFSLMLIMIRH